MKLLDPKWFKFWKPGQKLSPGTIVIGDNGIPIKTDERGQVVKELTQAMDEANAVPPTDKDIPKVLVPILGQANRTFRRRWIRHNRKLWDDAWRYQKLQEEIAAKGAVVIKP